MRFLGMAGFYRRFCKIFSTIASPLTNLLKKATKYNWTDSCHNAFNNIKSTLIESPALSTPDFTKQFKLQVDASDVVWVEFSLKKMSMALKKLLVIFQKNSMSTKKIIPPLKKSAWPYYQLYSILTFTLM